MPLDKYLLVLSILEGRYFPKNAACQLIVEARFDGELMATDPVEHTTDPDFNTDLAWEVDKRGLHVLRISRTPIKLQCFAVNKKTQSKSAVGYIILDIRLAQFSSMKPKWHPILNSAYSMRPELLLGINLETDDVDNKTTATKMAHLTNKVKTVAKPPETNFAYDFNELKPSLNEEYGYYQIGPPDKCDQVFAFSFTIGFAANLEQLIPATLYLPNEHRGFFFYFSLLGNDILTDPFQNLALADFSPERATVKLRSNVEALRAFFYHQAGIQVHLCSGEMSLGSVEVSLKNLLIEGSTDIFMQPVTIENSYELKSSRLSQMNEIPDECKPIIGIAVVLKHETQQASMNQVEPIVLNSSPELTRHQSHTHHNENSTLINKHPLQYPHSPPQKLTKSTKTESLLPPLQPVSTPNVFSSSGNGDVPSQSFPHETSRKNAAVSEPVEVTSANSDALQKYELSIELTTIKNVSLPSHLKCSLRYSHSYFGNMSPIILHPASELQKGSSVDLQHGCTIFSFATLPKHLKESFNNSPLQIDVLQNDEKVGQGILDMDHVVDQERVMIVNNNGKPIWKQNCTETIPIFHDRQLVAEVQVSLILEDHGPYEDEKSKKAAPIEVHKPQTNLNDNMESHQLNIMDDRVAEQIALELEHWKEWQESMFLKNLKDKESRHMEALTNEWTKRETEREVLTKKKLLEYQGLEEKLKSALFSVEKKENQCKIKEAELQRMKSDLQSEYDRHMQDFKDATRRLKEECEHKIELERSKNNLLQEQCSKLQRQLSETEKRLQIKDAEFQAFKEQKTQPEIKLQMDLNLLLLEKGELERKVNSLTKSKVHYKQQYGRCLRDLARLKQGMQAEAQEQLRKQQRELEQMKLQLLASEQQASLKGHRQVLQELKTDLQRVPLHLEENVGMQANSEIAAAGGMGSRDGDAFISGSLKAKVGESCLAHLVEEKESLLKTGVYSIDDPLIQELDKQIKEVIIRLKQ